MKVRRLVLCMLLSLALVVTFIPMISFAEGEDSADTDIAPAAEGASVEEQVSEESTAKDKTVASEKGTTETEAVKAKEVTSKSIDDDWYMDTTPRKVRLADDDYEYIYGWVEIYNDEIELEYTWKMGDENPIATDWEALTPSLNDDYLYFESEHEVDEVGTYNFYVREKNNPSEIAKKPFIVESFSWKASAVERSVGLEGSSKTLEVVITGDVPEGLTYRWDRYDSATGTTTDLYGETSNTLLVSTPGSYTCYVMEYDQEEEEVYTQYVYFDVTDHDVNNYLTVFIKGIQYELNSENDADGAGVWGYDSDTSLSGNISFLSSVKLSNGKVYPVTKIDLDGSYLPKEVTSVTIPASVKYISGIGYYQDEDDNMVPVPGFTIFGKTGSAAQTYAKEEGFKFRDPAAEAEAARQGTPDASMPAVKAKKPKAAKKAITVKWKKLKKKQLKKVAKIEVWVSTNTAFAKGATIEKTVSKKKASVKIKGLKKGTTYFAKVRAIKYVNGKKVVGKWSTIKKVKVKK